MFIIIGTLDKKEKKLRLTRLFAFVFFFSSHAALTALLGVTFIRAIFREFNWACSHAIAVRLIWGTSKRVFFFHKRSNYHWTCFRINRTAPLRLQVFFRELLVFFIRGKAYWMESGVTTNIPAYSSFVLYIRGYSLFRALVFYCQY